MSERMLVTGAKGMMSSDIVPILGSRYELFLTDIDTMDITDINAVRRMVDETSPSRIVHLAALTDLERCERAPELAMSVNAGGTRNIAEVCRESGIGMVYISTSGVFSGGSPAPYSEDSEPMPVNTYGKSKLEGESWVKEILADGDYLIVRVGWLFGGGALDKKFVGKMFKLLSERDVVRVVSDIFGSPNYSVDFGNTLLYLIEHKYSGLFHCVNEGQASRYEIAIKMAEYMGSSCRVEPCPALEFPSSVRRPPREAIANKRLHSETDYRMRSWDEALEEYIYRLRCELV